MHRAMLMAIMLMLPAHAWAQTAAPVQALDQSLLDSEPVEDVPDDAAILNTTPTPATPATMALPTPDPALEYDTALLQGLKKVTAETMTFKAPLNTPIIFGSLTITVKKCVKSRPEDEPENSALMLIEDHKPGIPAATAFSGWMFSSSPGISSLEHPVYDITVIDCVASKPNGDSPPPPVKAK